MKKDREYEKRKAYVQDILQKHDGHTHTWGHCVITKRDDLHWESLPLSLEDKLQFIKGNIRNLLIVARAKGIEALAITEHPCFERYGIPYAAYKAVFDECVYEFGKDLRVLHGIEANVKMDPKTQEVYIDLRDPTYEEMQLGIGIDALTEEERENMIERLHDFNPIICSIHPKHFIKADIEITQLDYFRLLQELIEQMGQLKNTLTSRKNKPTLILGHPWSLPHGYNRQAYSAADKGVKERFKNPAEFDQSEHAAIRFFSTKRTRHIARMLVDHNIVPELNSHYIRKTGLGDDISKMIPKGKRTNIVESYIRLCLKEDKIPLISPSSDTHTNDPGNLESDAIAEHVHNIEKGVSWLKGKKGSR